MTRFLLPLLFIALISAACTASSESGQASEPELSIELEMTGAGNAALTTFAVDADTCEGVLADNHPEFSLSTRSHTSAAVKEAQKVELNCTASYETSTPGGPFMSVGLIKFETDRAAIDRYEMIKEGFVINSLPISELNNSDESLMDHVSVLIDSDGMGRIISVRQNSRLLTVSIGPTMDAVPWTAADIGIIGKSIMKRWSE
jgi:hypothetical protein